MSDLAAYHRELQALEQRLVQDKPTDILQFCSDYFIRRLADERTHHLSKKAKNGHTPEPLKMSGATFTSPFAANSNPFGGDSRMAETRSGSRSPAPPEMLNIIEEDENDAFASPSTPSFSLSNNSGGGSHSRGLFGGDAPTDGPPSSMRNPPDPNSYPPQYNFGRRTSVSAESLKPVADVNDNWTPPTFPKTPDQLERLKTAISGNFLFNHLDDEQSAQILGALVEKPIPAKDIKVSKSIGR